VQKSTSLIGWDLFTIVEISLLSYLFFSILTTEWFKKLILFTSIPLIIYSITKLFIDKSDTFDSNTAAMEAILMIIFSLLYFYEQIAKPTVETSLFIYNTPVFWIVVAFLLFFSGTFFLFIYSHDKDVLNNSEFNFQYRIINNTFMFLRNVLLGVAMLVKQDKKDTYRKIIAAQ
jgi:hypothetical protein